MNKAYRDQGIVLRTQDLGEADRIVTILTQEHGKVRVVAKGVRKTKSRFGARLEPFSHVDLLLHEGRTFDVVSQVESLHAYYQPIVANYELYTVGSALLEAADQLVVVEGEPDLAHFTLLYGAIHALVSTRYAPELILNSYILRAMSYSGWELAIFDCAVCGTPGPHQAFNVYLGGAVCENCRPPGCVIPSVETWQLLAALAMGDWAVAQKADEPTRKSVGALVAAYLQWHLERQINSLKFVHGRMIS